jgi:hypothetical protein
MTVKRTVPTLLVCASLMALATSGCCWDRYHRGGGRRHLTSLDPKVEALPSAQAAVAAR